MDNDDKHDDDHDDDDKHDDDHHRIGLWLDIDIISMYDEYAPIFSSRMRSSTRYTGLVGWNNRRIPMN